MSADAPTSPEDAPAAAATELSPARRRIGLRLQIALAMVLLAILGAITAYRGGVAEMESALFEQKLDQDRLLELYFRQDRTDGALLRESLSIRQQDDERMARQLMRDADKARAENDADRALRLDLKAQEEAAAARALREVYWILPGFNGGYSIEQQVHRRVVQQLNSLGFEASLSAPPNPEAEAAQITATTDTIWPALESEIAAGHTRVRWLAFGVVGFVAALVFLTIADIVNERPWKRGLLYLGTALGVLPTALSIETDPHVVPWFVGAVLAFAALVFLGWLTGALQGPEQSEGHFHPAELERRRYAGADLVSHVVHDRFSQLAVFSIAAAVLLSALVGAWFSTADTRARQAGLDAVGFETDMLKRGSLFGVSRAIVLGDIAQTLDQRARVASAAAGATTLPELDQPGASMLQALRMHTAQYTSNALEFILDPDQGVVGDPHFPSQVVANLALPVDREEPQYGLHHNAWEAFAKWDAARTASIEAHHRAVRFLATLTVFAVAIYLLGQALGMSGGRAAIVLAGLGIAFVVVGTVGAVRAELATDGAKGATVVPEACALDPESWGPIPGGLSALLAARQFGIGVTLLDTAYTTDGYDRAIDHLRCAVQLRPDLAEAKRRLAEAIFAAGSSQMGESYMSLPGPDALKEVLEVDESALEEAQKQDLSPSRSGLRTSIALDGALVALVDHDEFKLEQSVWAARKALDELPAANDAMADSRTVRQFNFAVILLAAGNRDGALATYGEALKRRGFDTDLLVSAITDLQAVLALRCPGDGTARDCATLRQDVEALTADIVRAMATASSDLQVAVAPGSVAADITTSSLTARFKPAAGGTPGRLVLLWYAMDPAWNAWRVLPDPSGPVARNGARTADAEVVIPRALGDNWACMHGGRYRLEAYVDGTRVGAAELQFDDTGAVPFRFRDLNLILCAPAAWQRWSGPAETTDTRDVSEQPQDMLEGAMLPAKGARPVLYLRTVPGPRAGRDVTVDLEAAVRHVHGETRVLKRVETREECLAAAQPGVLLERAWRTTEGAAELALGLVPDESSAVSSPEVCDVLASVSTLYRPLEPQAP